MGVIMNKEIAMRIAAEDKTILKTSDFMKKTNEVFEANLDGNSFGKPFAQIDIVFATFTDYVKETANDREKDLLITSEFLQKCWSVLHISVQTLGEKISPIEKEDIKILKKSLDNLALSNLLTDGLNKKTLKILQELCEENESNDKTAKKIKVK